jgi:peroxiredoxin
MTDAPPPEALLPSAPEPGPEQGPAVRPPRKRFILIGLGIALLIILILGLTTSIGTNSSTTSQPSEGGPVPTFSATNVGLTGSGQVSIPADGGGNGTPAVLLFFGAWCDSCRQELPPLAAAVRQQDKAGRALAKVRVIGVDSFDATSTAKSFIRKEGVTFPVAADPQADITGGLFYFHGDPYAVFVKGDGTIDRIVAGAQLTPSSFTADERALLPAN